MSIDPAPKAGMSTNKKLAIGCIGLLIVGGLCSVAASGMGLWGVAQVGTEMANTDATKAAAPGGSVASAAGLNTEVKVGDLAYTVTEASTEAADAGKLIVVRYAVRNDGADMKSVWGLELVDDKGRAFQETTMFGSPHVPEGQDCIFTSMNPGMSETCTKLFEVPADAAGLMFHVTGLLDGDAYVDIGQ